MWRKSSNDRTCAQSTREQLIRRADNIGSLGSEDEQGPVPEPTCHHCEKGKYLEGKEDWPLINTEISCVIDLASSLEDQDPGERFHNQNYHRANTGYTGFPPIIFPFATDFGSSRAINIAINLLSSRSALPTPISRHVVAYPAMKNWKDLRRPRSRKQLIGPGSMPAWK